jgi:holin-like protein
VFDAVAWVLLPKKRRLQMQALRGLVILLLLQMAGEGLTQTLSLPYPGPVVGLLLLLVALNASVLVEPVCAIATFLLSHLSLLFIPVAVGVIVHLSVLSQYAMELLLVITLSTCSGMVVTALVLQWFMQRRVAPKLKQDSEVPNSEVPHG